VVQMSANAVSAPDASLRRVARRLRHHDRTRKFSFWPHLRSGPLMLAQTACQFLVSDDCQRESTH
jgi:hypothetical protein